VPEYTGNDCCSVKIKEEVRRIEESDGANI
jgi:hypothetical protein